MVFLGSLVMNVYLLMLIAVLSADGLDSEVLMKGSEDQIVAVYTVMGVIDSRASKKFSEFYNHVWKDQDIRAVVIRVESPGGGVAASEEIHHMIVKLKDSGRRVVVSMGGVAASGGYMISAPADEIFAEPSTITGSIGVIAQVPNLQGTMKKIGVKMRTFKSTHAQGWKDLLSPFKKTEERERLRMIEILDTIQAGFEQIVRDGRGERLKTKQDSYEMIVGQGEDARTVAVTETEPFNGKIYLPHEAKQLGLIDTIGFLGDACQKASKLAGLNNPTIRHYKPRESLFTKLFASQSASINIDISPEAIEKLQTPKILVLWTMD